MKFAACLGRLCQVSPLQSQEEALLQEKSSLFLVDPAIRFYGARLPRVL